ncbi:hypothetical protein K438DRAFT_2097194 [Mycena galopus ATCC 62051]|nr:hypothetical protein K438DRAFT_2097194 [Mycena galopus ATCC 62051]
MNDWGATRRLSGRSRADLSRGGGPRGGRARGLAVKQDGEGAAGGALGWGEPLALPLFLRLFLGKRLCSPRTTNRPTRPHRPRLGVPPNRRAAPRRTHARLRGGRCDAKQDIHDCGRRDKGRRVACAYFRNNNGAWVSPPNRRHAPRGGGVSHFPKDYTHTYLPQVGSCSTRCTSPLRLRWVGAKAARREVSYQHCPGIPFSSPSNFAPIPHHPSLPNPLRPSLPVSTADGSPYMCPCAAAGAGVERDGYGRGRGGGGVISVVTMVRSGASASAGEGAGGARAGGVGGSANKRRGAVGSEEGWCACVVGWGVGLCREADQVTDGRYSRLDGVIAFREVFLSANVERQQLPLVFTSRTKTLSMQERMILYVTMPKPMKAPTYRQTTNPICDTRNVVRSSSEMKPASSPISTQWLHSAHARRDIRNNMDAAFRKDSEIPKPLSVFLDYNYGIGALKWWGRGD